MTLDWINGLANIAQFAIPAAILVWADLGGRLGSEAVSKALKAVARYLKLPAEDIDDISGHSVRVGATQDLLALNVDLASVMREGRWKTVRMPMRYGEHVMAGRAGMARAAAEQGRDADRPN